MKMKDIVYSVGNVKRAIDSDLNINMRDERGCSLLHAVNDEDVAKYLIEIGVDVNARDRNGRTPLFRHSLFGNIGIMKILIEAGADVNAADKYGDTPLFVVLNPDCARLLIDAGANLNAVSNSGENPVHANCYSDEYYDILKVLVDAGADINTRDINGKTPLEKASPKAYSILREKSFNDNVF